MKLIKKHNPGLKSSPKLKNAKQTFATFIGFLFMAKQKK